MKTLMPIILTIMLSFVLVSPMITIKSEAENVVVWEHWNDIEDTININLITESQLKNIIGIENLEGYPPSSTFYCWSPYIIDTDGTLQKGYWLSSVRPKYCVWEYYDPVMHKFCKIKKDVAIVREGNFDGANYAFADHNEFIIPALFLPERYGNWLVRTYFIFENGETGAEGPAVDSNGNSYMIQFPVVEGSKFDLFFKAPIYIFGYKTIPLFFWLTPIWALLIFIVIMVIYTKSVVGAVEVIKSAIRATGEAKRKWRAR